MNHKGLVLVSHVGESTEDDGGGSGVFSLKLLGNLSVCDNTSFQHGLVTSAARAHLWYLMLAKNEDMETRKSDSKHFVHVDAEFQEQSKGGSMESVSISHWKQHLILTKGKRN